MALAIRPIPTVTGRDAERFIKAAEAAEKNPHTIALSISDSDVENILRKAKLKGALRRGLDSGINGRFDSEENLKQLNNSFKRK